MLKLIKRILNFGITGNTISLEEKHSIKLINQISLFVIILTALGDIGEIGVMGWQLIVHTIIFKLGFICALYLNYKRKINAAAIVFSSMWIFELISVPFLVPHTLNADGLFLSIIVLIGAALRKTTAILIFAFIDLCLLIGWHVADSYSLIQPMNVFKPEEKLFIEISYSIVMMVALLIGLLSFKRSAKEYQEGLTQNLQEKDILLKEIHHRVKNNLQVILSMIGLRGHTIKSEESLELLKDIKARVVSMALVHNKLQEGEGVQKVDLKNYFTELSNLLVQMYNSSQIEIVQKNNIEPCVTGIEISIPLGLIITEVITNSIKHAIVAGKVNTLEISGKRINEDKYIISIKDNGPGISTEINQHKSLGFLSINILCKQIGASLERINNNGLETIITINI
jgi:two-component sensor histidine kinase/cytochrome c oxidase subunit IV